MGKLQIEKISISYQNKPVIHDLSFTVNNGEIVSLLGPSGTGKTTVLKAIAGLLKPDSGKIKIEGVDVTKHPAEKRDLVLIFQKPLLFPFLNVEENIGFGLRMKKQKGKNNQKKIARMLEITDLTGLEKRKPHQLSGGQQQRVALARGLVLEPSAILLDEPLSNLDYELRLQMRQLILDIHQTTSTTMLFVTHDQHEALSMSDKLLLLLDGSMRQSGSPEELFYRPVDKEAACFFGCTNFLQGHVVNKQFNSKLITCPINHDNQADVTAMIRPEDIKLSTTNKSAYFKALIIRKDFEGTSTKIVITIGEVQLTVRTMRSDLVIGDTIWAYLPMGKLHILKKNAKI